ncbi:MAG: hypothetical protein SOV54_00600 [Faecalibacterium prausnitzii]|nr:hypothetical protein [Faecalibacterium prausnitzii]MDY2681239.1 hypothetical protein [Faecalibacterium prausnitzii]
MKNFLSFEKDKCRTILLYTRGINAGKNHFHKKTGSKGGKTAHLLEKTLRRPFCIAPGF